MTATKPGIATALLEVQRNAPDLHKDATNPHFKNRYVTLDTVLATIRPLLNQHGVLLTQLPAYDDDGRPTLRSILRHAETGEEVQSEMLLLAPKQDPQGQGSAITYARRYSLLAMLGLTADEDDDGNAGSKPSSSTDLADKVAALPDTRELAGPEVLEQIEKKRKEVGTSPSALKAHIVNTHSRDSLADLGLDEARMVYSWLDAKAARKAA